MRSNFQPIGRLIVLEGLLSAATGFGFLIISIPLNIGYFTYGLPYGSAMGLTLLLLLAFGMGVGYSATKIRSKLVGEIPNAHWAWVIVSGTAAVLASYVLAWFAVPTIVNYLYQLSSENYVAAVAAMVLAVLAISPFCGLATEYIMSLEQPSLSTDEKHISHGESLKCPHCNAIYTYDMVHLQDGQVRCQNCGKTVSFNTAEIA